MSYKVIIVEDVKEIADIVSLHLTGIDEVETTIIHDGYKAIDEIETGVYDIIILDLTLPGISGYEILKKVRENGNTPVIIVTAKNLDTEKILGLNLGADDYITKPFNPLELVARVKVQLRKMSVSSDKTSGVLWVKDIKLNTKTCDLFVKDIRIDLTYTEYKLILFFMKHPNQVFTKKQLYTAVWDENEEIYFDNTVMVYISRLREKIESEPKNPRYIKTIRGLGYKFATE